MKDPARILVTSALPYANGPIHIGHLVEYIQTDIWVRFQKLTGRRCVYVCADDTHGTAIMISARKAGISEEAFIAKVNAEHQRDFAGFQIQFDNYGSTNCPENRELCGIFWTKLRNAGLIKEKSINQLYDATAGTFLADRFVKGTCPVCKSPNQYGDNCDKCSSTYTPADLIEPVSTLSGTKPEIRSATHLFVELEKLHGFLQEWTQSGEHLQTEVANYLKGHFLGDELRDWDVSRPAPYFGFEIPDSPGNYWYVWFDAPIGYIASTWQWCKIHGEQLADWWQSPDCEVHHFIGKDITYFHTLFWPGMLKTAGYNLPEKVHIHGFLTVGGEKMSKSKGTFVRAETFLKHLDPAALRFYYASKLGPRLDDLDLNPEEFIDKVNSDIVGKVVNLASRTAKFVEETGLSDEFPEVGWQWFFPVYSTHAPVIAEAYQSCDFARAVRQIMFVVDSANAFVDRFAPWKLAKASEQQRDVCTIALNLFRQIVVLLSPIMPALAERVGELFNKPIISWDELNTPLTGVRIQKYSHLFKRVEKKDFDAMIEEEKAAAVPAEAPASTAPSHPVAADSDAALLAEPLLTEQISIDDFTKVDLRVARVLEASEVPEAKKLLKLKLSMGGGVERQVFAGIKAAYKPEQLVGRLVVMVANLAPRQMKFGLSEGMVTACGPGGPEVFLLALDEGATPGMRVH